MALNFPDNPSINQIYTDSTSGFSYVWDGTVWISYESSDLSTVLELDDISSNFNGSTTTFALNVSGSPMSPENATQMQIYLGGVLQNPNDDFTLSSGNIVFSTAPVAGLNFVGILLGVSFPITSVSDGSITLPKLAANAKGVGISSNGTVIGIGATNLDFVGTGHTFSISGGTATINIKTGIGSAVNYPAGNKSPISSINNIIEAGVCSAGLRTTQFPAAKAGASFHVAIRSGKFHGII